LTLPQGFDFSHISREKVGMKDFGKWMRRWWPGLIPLALLWAVAAWTSMVPMEQELTARAGAEGHGSGQNPD
jgi:hypothetical protein